MNDRLDGQYFNDMWLALEQELTSFDNFLSDKDWAQSSSDSAYTPDDSPNADGGGGHITPETFEELLQERNHGPSKEELRSKNRAERIEAVKELYNQVPTIISASSLAQMHRTANKLYKVGNVKEANILVTQADQTVQQDFSYVEESDDFTGSLELTSDQGDTEVTVEIMDKETDETIKETFGNLFEAVKFYLKSTKNKVE